MAPFGFLAVILVTNTPLWRSLWVFPRSHINFNYMPCSLTPGVRLTSLLIAMHCDIAFYDPDDIGTPFEPNFGAQSLDLHLTAYNLPVYA